MAPHEPAGRDVHGGGHRIEVVEAELLAAGEDIAHPLVGAHDRVPAVEFSRRDGLSQPPLTPVPFPFHPFANPVPDSFVRRRLRHVPSFRLVAAQPMHVAASIVEVAWPQQVTGFSENSAIMA